MKSKLIISLKIIIVLSLVFTVGINIYQLLFHRDPFTSVKAQSSYLNLGEKYQGRLNFWYLMAENGDWSSAAKIENTLDSNDINNYKSAYEPQELQKKLTNLNGKPNKTPDDWVELARIQSMIGNIVDAKKSLTEAFKLDPVRDDIQKLYYQFN